MLKTARHRKTSSRRCKKKWPKVLEHREKSPLSTKKCLKVWKSKKKKKGAS